MPVFSFFWAFDFLFLTLNRVKINNLSMNHAGIFSTFGHCMNSIRQFRLPFFSSPASISKIQGKIFIFFFFTVDFQDAAG
jgi:hypothetical protein